MLNRGILFSFISVGLTSVSYPILKTALQTISPMQAAFLEALFTVLFCYAFGIIRKKPVGFFGNRSLLLIGVINTLGAIALYWSLDLLNPVTAGILGRNTILFSVLLAIFVLHEPLSRAQLLLIAAGVVGSFLFVYGDGAASDFLGVVFSLLYTFLFALTNLLTKTRTQNIDSNSILFVSKLISTVGLFFVGFVTSGMSWFEVNPGGTGLVFISAFLTIFLGLNFFYAGLKHIDLNLATMIRATSPIFVVLYSWPFFPPRFDPINIVGGITLVSTVFLLIGSEAMGWFKLPAPAEEH